MISKDAVEVGQIWILVSGNYCKIYYISEFCGKVSCYNDAFNFICLDAPHEQYHWDSAHKMMTYDPWQRIA